MNHSNSEKDQSFEEELYNNLELEHHHQEQYDDSDKGYNFLIGALLGLGISLSVHLLLSWSIFFMYSPSGLILWLYQITGIIFVLGCGYLGMKSMGDFNQKLIGEVKNLFSLQ